MDNVVAVITNGSRVLIGKVATSKIDDFGGIQYVFPGGSVEDGEVLEHAAVREAKEETSLDVVVVTKIGERVHPVTQKAVHYFHCEANSEDTSVDNPQNDDLERLLWVENGDLKKYMPTLYERVVTYIEKLSVDLEEN